MEENVERSQIAYVPKWEGPIAGWTINYIKKNYWKVANSHEFDDLIQECQIKFILCKRKYPDVTTPKHFMSLYKSAVTRLFHSLSSKEMARSDNSHLTPEELARAAEIYYGKDHNLGPLFVEFSKFPGDIQELIIKLFDAKSERISKGKKYSGKLKQRKTTNEYYCELLGKDPDKFHIADKVRDVLRNVSSIQNT